MLTEVLAYRLLLLLSTLGSLAVAARVWRRRSAPASGSIAVLLAAMAEWALAVLLGDLARDSSTKLLFNTASYVGIAAIPVAWVAVALQYAGFHRWLTRPRLLLLSFVPLASVIVAATNGAHGLFWSGVEIWEKNGEISLELAIGPWFVVHTVYSYLLLAVGVGLLTRTILGSSAASYKQTTTYLIALALPWTVNVLYHLGIGFFPGRDPTPAAFGLTAVLMAVGHARFQLLDVLPVARSAIIEALTDAVIVVDGSQRIAELNPTASKLLAVDIADALGQPAAQVLAEHPILLRQCAGRSESQEEVTLITTRRRAPLRPPERGSAPPRQQLGRPPVRAARHHRAQAGRRRAEGVPRRPRGTGRGAHGHATSGHRRAQTSGEGAAGKRGEAQGGAENREDGVLGV